MSSDTRVQLDAEIENLRQKLIGNLSQGLHDPEVFLDLGIAHKARYEETYDQDDLNEAIANYKKAVDQYPADHDYYSLVLNNLGSSLHTRFHFLGDVEDLEEAMLYHRQALSLRPPGHSERSHSLNNLANVLQTHFNEKGRIEYLEEAVNLHSQALELRPPGHLLHIQSLNNLGLCLRIHFEELGNVKDLDAALNFHRQSLSLAPLGHSEHAGCLTYLANTLRTYYEHQGNIKYLEEGLMYLRQGLDLFPSNHPDLEMHLTNLAGTLQIRFEQLGMIEDIEEAIRCLTQAISLCPVGHPSRSTALNNIANSLQTRFEELGNIEDLEKAIDCYREAHSLSPAGHSQKSSFLNNIGNALQTRSTYLGSINDVNEAIICHNQALELLPLGHSDLAMSLHNLGKALFAKFEQSGMINDLQEAVKCYYKVLEIRLLNPEHPEYPACLHNLAYVLHAQFNELQNLEDLQKAVAFHQEALELLSPGHPDYTMFSTNLADVLRTRFEHLGKSEDQELAGMHYTQAGLDLSKDHPYYLKIMVARASLEITIHASTFFTCQTCSHLTDAFSLLDKVVNHSRGSIAVKSQAANLWAKTAHKYGHESAVNAYSTALLLQQQNLVLLPSVESQQQLMTHSTTLALDAASCALESGHSEVAIEFLEQGRAILWSKIQGYRHPMIEQLTQKHPQLAHEFRDISQQLEHHAISAEAQLNTNTGTLHDTKVKLQRKLSGKWAELLNQIRKIDGYSDFLQVKPFHKLQHAAAGGPIIIVNISEFQSHAIIVLFSEPPLSVKLPYATPDTLKNLATQLSVVTQGSGSVREMIAILRELWNIVVLPVKEQLRLLGVAEKSRIWWCPTSYLCALPLHASGSYKKGEKSLPDLFISSYTPTLSSLIRARSGLRSTGTIPDLLLISQPETLPKVIEEINVIKQLGNIVYSLAGKEADRDTVLSGLQDNSWVHFACHGHLNEQPFNSWFELHNNEHLTVLDLAQAQLPNAELAFLSACHSAAGNVHGTPDEVIHLAGALQFGGFKNVIGTLWAMVDDDGPTVAQVFYSHMFRNPNRIDFSESAEALSLATKHLRRARVPVDRWINFVHIGA
jgi:tetratricopeptide (TPR) repeat protein